MSKAVDDQLFEWWKERHGKEFIKCMGAWALQEAHSDEATRKNRIAFYLDQVGKGDIKKILMMRHGDDLVHMLDEYLQRSCHEPS